MKTKYLCLFGAVLLLLFSNNTYAQAPSIYYTPSTNLYSVGTPIPALTPINNGGTVPALPGYGYTTTVTNTGLGTPVNIVYDNLGHLYITDRSGGYIKMIDTATKAVTIIAGNGTAAESDNAIGTMAAFNAPVGIAYDGTGYLYITDYAGEVIRKVSTTAPYAVTTIAGNGTRAHADGSGITTAEFNRPRSIIYDAVSNCLFVSDYGSTNNGALRKIDLSSSPSVVSTIALGLPSPYNLTYDGANFYIVNYNIGNVIIKILGTSPYTVSTLAGNGTGAELDATGTAAAFNAPSDIVYDKSGYFYVSDYSGHTVRRVSVPGAVVTTLAGQAGASGSTDGTAIAARFKGISGITIDNAGSLYVIDKTAFSIRKINITGYTISPNLPAGLTIDPGTGVITGTPAASFPTTTYTITAYNVAGSSSSNITLGCGTNYDWVGGTSNDWTDPLNWSSNIVPGSADNARIGVFAFTNQPSINSNVTVGSVTFGPTVQPALSISASASLTVNSNFTINANATPSITGAGSGSTVARVNMAPGSIVTIDPTIGTTLTLSLPLSFTLQSNATADAAIGPLASASVITGTAAGSINVQRYLSAARGYRLLSSPVNAGSATSGGNTFNIYSINYLSDSTYLQGTNSSGGFDRTGNPTLYIYRESLTPQFNVFTASNFRGINNLTASPSYTLDVDGSGYNIPVTNGYLLYFIGSRSPANTNPWLPGTTTPDTLTASGALNMGTIATTHWYAPGATGLSFTTSTPVGPKGTNLVGNPYPSAINWDTFQTTSLSNGGIYGVNVEPVIYVLNPITQNYGSYIAGYGVGSAAFVSNIIASGEGFFVYADTTAAQLVFTESAKFTTNASIPVSGVFSAKNTGHTQNSMTGTPAATVTRPLAVNVAPATNISQQQYFRLKMGQSATNSDETLIRFNSTASVAYNKHTDALYKSGYGSVNMSTLASSKNISIKTIPYPFQKDDTVKLAVSAKTDGIYQLSLTDMANIPQMYDIWLKDNYKKDSLDIKHNLTYSFNFYKADTSSYGNNRFSLIIRKNPAYGYRLLNFTANRVINNTQVLVTWKTENEGNSMNFIVQRSTNGGKSYITIDSLQGTNAGLYAFTDKNPVNGTNMYRLAQVDENKAVSYSNVVSVVMINLNNLNKNLVSIYPNPGKDMTNISIDPSAQSTAYDIKFINSWGIIKKQFTTTQSNWSGSIANLETGIYVIQVSAGANLIGEGKFIKQ